MGQPPGQNGVSSFLMDRGGKLSPSNNGPKFLVMERVQDDNSSNTETLKNVSPFLIKKVIDSTCNGTVDLCKKLRNGSVLIKTKNSTQASSLIRLCSLSTTIKVSVTEHKSLNFIKGVINSNDLRGIPDEETIAELREQNVTQIQKIVKSVDGKLVETGLIILTFVSHELPINIFVGYERVRVRAYIPMPLRCINCCLYGHTAKFCNNNKICGNCSKPFHIVLENDEKCNNNKCCINCKTFNYESCNHAVFGRTCPIFLKEKEVQSIITLEKVNRFAAIKTNNSRHPSAGISVAELIKRNTANNSVKAGTTVSPNNSPSNPGLTGVLVHNNTSSSTIVSTSFIFKSPSVNLLLRIPLHLISLEIQLITPIC